MQIYHYHPDTGEFIGESTARPDPLEEGRFLVPGFATEIKPPEPGSREAAVFDGSKWVLTPDFRGVDYWISYGDKHTITELGQTVPDGAYLEEPEAPEPEPYVPSQVTRAQGKAALIQAGLWQDVLDYVDGIEDPTQKALAEVALNDTTHWMRSSPFLAQAAMDLGLSSEDLDNLFIQADSIEL